MSRSRKKSPFSGITTATSEKDDKRNANRRLRKRTKQAVNKGRDVLPELRELSNVWCFDKDGKIYLKNPNPKDLRK